VQVLDAPSLQDDFYLNLVDWSSQNMLAVGLGTCVYLWSASSSKVSFFRFFLSFFLHTSIVQ
jgi:cell division cycle 20-like protein 1 (cofactor of APC complex)